MPFPPIWNDSGVSSQLCMGNEPSPASHTHRCLRGQIWDRNTRGTQGQSCPTVQEHPAQDKSRIPPELLPSPGQSKAQGWSSPGAEGARRGSPHSLWICSSCVPSPAASPASTSSSRNANQWMCRTWKGAMISLMKALPALFAAGARNVVKNSLCLPERWELIQLN